MLSQNMSFWSSPIALAVFLPPGIFQISLIFLPFNNLSILKQRYVVLAKSLLHLMKNSKSPIVLQQLGEASGPDISRPLRSLGCLSFLESQTELVGQSEERGARCASNLLRRRAFRSGHVYGLRHYLRNLGSTCQEFFLCGVPLGEKPKYANVTTLS